MNDTVIIFCAFSCMCRAQLWAESLGVPYSAETWKAVCIEHFAESDFTSSECIRLNRMAVLTVCTTTSHSHSTPEPTELTFSTPPVSSSSPLVAGPETNENLFQVVHNDIQNIFKHGALHSPRPC